MNRATFVAALQEQGIPATTIDGTSPDPAGLAAWADLDHDLADPVAFHRATTLAGSSTSFEDWLDEVTTTADEVTLAWLTRWDLA